MTLLTWRAARRPRRPVVALARLLLALVVVAGIVHSGARYFYCDALGLADVDPCLQASHGSDARCPTRALDESRADCCAIIVLRSIPPSAQSQNPSVPRAAVLALLPAALYLDRALGDERRARSLGFERWRTPPRSAQQARAQLMVFLT